MNPEDLILLRNLLTSQRVAILSVVVEGEPITGLVPFAMQPDFSAAIIHASALARHTAGLLEGAPFSLMIHTPDEPARDPSQLARVSLQGQVHVFRREKPAYDRAQKIYVAKHPQSAPIFKLPDFRLYELRIQKGRYVPAFGRIYNLVPATLEKLVE